MRILRRRQVKERTGRSDASIWRDERAGRFPRRVQIGPNAVGWLEEEINDWLGQRAAERAPMPQPERAKTVPELEAVMSTASAEERAPPPPGWAGWTAIGGGFKPTP